jgi:hypothetical protein
MPEGTPEALEYCSVATATTPLGILFVLSPVRRQLADPARLLELSDFNAPVACGPGVMATEVMAVEG